VVGGRAVQPDTEWELVTAHAAWSARDSQAEIVHDGKMWLLGGWHASDRDSLRDVWASADGLAWHLVSKQAPWRHGDLAAAVSFGNRMWILGGWSGGNLPKASASREVWSSVDGKKWRRTRAAWSPRLGLAAAVLGDRIWVAGGAQRYYDGGAGNLLADVWSSRDGKKWERALAHAPWAPRAYHALVAWRGKLWLLGGGNYRPSYVGYNDVWCSEDGRTWRQVTASAPWEPRIWFSAVVYADRLWLLGGWSGDPSRNHGDVWSTGDGETWIRHDVDTLWAPRHEHSALVFKNQIWVAGGNTWPLVNDVWRMSLRSRADSSSSGAGDAASQGENTQADQRGKQGHPRAP
jgi:hypothetical protein